MQFIFAGPKRLSLRWNQRVEGILRLPVRHWWRRSGSLGNLRHGRPMQLSSAFWHHVSCERNCVELARIWPRCQTPASSIRFSAYIFITSYCVMRGKGGAGISSWADAVPAVRSPNTACWVRRPSSSSLCWPHLYGDDIHKYIELWVLSACIDHVTLVPWMRSNNSPTPRYTQRRPRFSGQPASTCHRLYQLPQSLWHIHAHQQLPRPQELCFLAKS